MSQLPTLGILGAGKLGVVLGQLATKAGYEVYISGSGSVDKIALTVEVLIPGAKAATSQEVASRSDIVILALPLSKFRELPKEALENKLVVDAMNYWWEVDGPRDDFIHPEQSSSEAVQEFLENSRIIKAFNHMGYHDLHDGARAKGEPDRKAIAIAGNDSGDVDAVTKLVDNLGFDPLYIGGLSQGKMLEAGTKAFGANLNINELAKLLNYDVRSR